MESETKLTIDQCTDKPILSSPTLQSSPDLTSYDIGNSTLLVDESEDSQLDDLYIDTLQGETLVPNSPSPGPSLIDEDNDGCIDKRGHPLACVFVANLNKFKTEEELNVAVHQKFEKWGKILNVKVLKDWMGRPYAFVQYENTSDAQQVLLKAAGTYLNGRRIRCEPARVNRTLVIVSKGLPLAKKVLTNEMSRYGPIDQIQVTQSTFWSSAQIKYTYRDDAINAYLAIQSFARFRCWTVEWIANTDSYDCGGKKGSFKNRCVFIGNLDKTISKAEIQERFDEYGTIENIKIIKKLDKKYKTTFGFIKYASYKSANRAIFAQNNQGWYGHKLRVLHQVNRRHYFANSSSHAHGMTHTPASFQSGLPRLRPHPPGLGITAAAAAANAAAHIYGAHPTSHVYPLPIGNQLVKKVAISRLSAQLTTASVTAAGAEPRINTNQHHQQHKHQEKQDDITVTETASNVVASPSKLFVNPATDNETHSSQQLVHSSYNFQSSEQVSQQYYSYPSQRVHKYGYHHSTCDSVLEKEQSQRGHSPMHENYYWYPSTQYHLAYPPMTAQAPPMQNTSKITYYQMYPYSGTFYFIPITTKYVPCMDPLVSTCTTIRPPPPPPLPPDHHTLTTTKTTSAKTFFVS